MYYLCSENKGTDQLRSYCEVTAKLICAFVFAQAKTQFSHDAAHFNFSNAQVSSYGCVFLAMAVFLAGAILRVKQEKNLSVVDTVVQDIAHLS